MPLYMELQIAFILLISLKDLCHVMEILKNNEIIMLDYMQNQT